MFKRIVILICSLALVMCTFGLSDNNMAYAESSAFSTIYVYNQGRSKASTDGQNAIRALWLDWGTDHSMWHYHYGVSSQNDDVNKNGGRNTVGNVPDSSKPDGENYGSGCGLYTQAHAIQWLNQKATSDPLGLMQSLIGVSGGSAPWDSAWNGAYNNLVCQLGNATCESMGSLNENKMYEVLTSGGVITLRIPGHYILAVGAVKKNSETWFHIIDSSCRSTMSRLKQEAYKFDWSGTAGTMTYSGGEYWISYNNCVSSSITPLFTFLPKNASIAPSTYTTIFHESSTYRIIKDRDVKREPYEAAESMGSLGVGDTVRVTHAVKNSYNNIWFKVAEGGYIYSGYTIADDGSYQQAGNQYIEFVSTSPNVKWESNNLDGISHTQGNKFALNGTITSNSTIKTITAQMYHNGSKWGTPYTATVNGTSYSLYGSGIDMNMMFGSLSSGKCRLDLTVEYCVNRVSTGTHTIKTEFTVGSGSSAAASTLKITGVKYPSTYMYNNGGYGYVVDSGTVSSNYALTKITTDIQNSSGSSIATGLPKTVTPSGTSYSISALNSVLPFSKISSAGTYYWIITATDSSGKSVTLKMPINAVASGSNTIATGTTETTAVTGVSVDLDEVTLRVGQTTKLTATVSPSNATNKSVTWKSSNTAVATVSNGTVTAKAGGTATITCTTADGGYTASCKVTVTTSVTGISLSPTALTLEWGKTSSLTATISPTNATNKTVHWSTSNSSVATVDNGVVKGVSAGTATITAMAEDGGYKATCVVTVKVSPTGVKLNTSSATLNVGNTTTLTATVSPSNATNKNVTWSSSNTAVATVSGGKVTAVANGTATITCKTADGGYTAACTVTVKTPVSGVTLDRDSATLKAGESFTLVPTVLPSTASNKNVTWSSGNTAVATVANGKVTAVSNGTASIYCSTEEGGYQVYCKVYVIDPVDLGSDFYAVIRHIDSGKLVDAESISNLANIHLTTEIFNESQIWHFVRQSDGYYKILQGEYLMELAGGNIADDTNIRLYRENDNAAQHWYIHKDGEGYHLTSRKAPGSCVDVRGNNSADGTNVQLFTENNTEGQRFSIEKCTLVSSLRLDANKIELNSIGESKSVTATVLPSNATYRNITWASDDLAVATVVDGTVVAVGSGITTITCTIDGSGHSASCRVIVYGEKLLKLPAALLQIDAEAFRYSIMDAVIVPEKAESIGSKAFADCDDLRIIYMPDSVVQIAEDAFDGSDNVCFVCESENAAATYAKKYSIPYVVE